FINRTYDLRAPRPESHAMTCSRRNNCKRSSPTSRSNDCDPFHVFRSELPFPEPVGECFRGVQTRSAASPQLLLSLTALNLKLAQQTHSATKQTRELLRLQ